MFNANFFLSDCLTIEINLLQSPVVCWRNNFNDGYHGLLEVFKSHRQSGEKGKRTQHSKSSAPER